MGRIDHDNLAMDWSSGGVRATITDSHGTITPVGPPTDSPMDNALVTALFTCNSADKLPQEFTMLDTNQSMVVNTGGADGVTSVGTLENANYAFVDTYIATNGDVQKSTAAAQRVVDASPLPVNHGDAIKKVP